MSAPSAIVYAPTESPFPSSTAAFVLPFAFNTSKRRKTRSSMPGEGCEEKLKVKGGEEAEVDEVGACGRKVGLKAFPLVASDQHKVADSRCRPTATHETTLVRRFCGNGSPGM